MPLPILTSLSGMPVSSLLFFFRRGGGGSSWVSQEALVVKNPAASAGDVRDVDSLPGSGRFLGGGHGNLLQFSCLENLMDR